MRGAQLWRGRRIAPAHEEPRNESNNKAHEPSGRSTRYGSGHLIRVFRDIEPHLFIAIPVRFCFLVASPTHRDLLLCAKHLFFAAMRRSSEPRAQARAMATSSTLPGGKKHHTAGASRAVVRRGKTPHPHASSVASRFPCLV